MKKVFRMEELECAHCAAKMETAIRKIDGVNSASISFIAQKITIDADDAVFEEVLQKAQKAVKKVEPDCRIVF